MSQHDVFIWLVEQRLMGNHGFFSVREIAQGSGVVAGELYKCARVQVNRLYAFGYLDVKRVRWLERRWRVKLKYVESVRAARKAEAGGVV